MNKMIISFFLILFSTTCSVFAGDVVRGNDLSQREFDNILNESNHMLHKLWNIIDQIIERDVDVYITPQISLGAARGMHSILINPRVFTPNLKNYPEDRLVVVLLHEYGHIVYNRKLNGRTSNRVDHEYAAFKYSVRQASYIAEDGDVGPIRQLIHYLPIRIKNGNRSDPHTIALKELTKERFWLEQLTKYQ